MIRSIGMRIAAALMAATVLAGPAAAQGVDRYEFIEMKKNVRQLLEDMERLRNAMIGGNMQQRFAALEDEISRLTGQIERLEFAVRRQEDETKRKLIDLEFRIIELEGGDPSILFQDDGTQDQGALQPAAPTSTANAAPQPSGSQTLGVLTRPIEGTADFEAGVAAARAGDAAEAKLLLQRFISNAPDNALAGDAHFWLGESHYALGEFREAARRYVDAAELFPGAPVAAQSLLKLGITLELLGKRDAACATFGEIGQRYPGSPAVGEAASEAARVGCG